MIFDLDSANAYPPHPLINKGPFFLTCGELELSLSSSSELSSLRLLDLLPILNYSCGITYKDTFCRMLTFQYLRRDVYDSVFTK